MTKEASSFLQLKTWQSGRIGAINADKGHMNDAAKSSGAFPATANIGMKCDAPMTTHKTFFLATLLQNEGLFAKCGIK